MKPRIKILKDRNPDLSYLGEYTDDLRPGVWVRNANAWFEDLPAKTSLPGRKPQAGVQPRYSGFRVQGTASSPPSTAQFMMLPISVNHVNTKLEELD